MCMRKEMKKDMLNHSFEKLLVISFYDTKHTTLFNIRSYANRLISPY